MSSATLAIVSATVGGASARRTQPSGECWKRSVWAGIKFPVAGCHVTRSTSMPGCLTRMTLKEFVSPLPRVEVAVPAWITNAECPSTR